MHLKISKEALISDVKYQANIAINNYLSANSYSLQYLNINELKRLITNAVSEGIAEGVKVTLDNLYTDDDFEKDLSLKP